MIKKDKIEVRDPAMLFISGTDVGQIVAAGSSMDIYWAIKKSD